MPQKRTPAKKKAATKKVSKAKKAPMKKKATPKKAAAKKTTTKKKVAPAKKIAAKKASKKPVAATKKAPAKIKKAAAKKSIAPKKTPAPPKLAVKPAAVKVTAANKPVTSKIAVKAAAVKPTSIMKNNKQEMKPTMSKSKKIDLPKVTQPAPVINKKTVAEKIEAKKAAPMRLNKEMYSGQQIIGPVPSIPPYKASSGEEYMNDAQLDHFMAVLIAWRKQVMEGVDKTVGHLRDDAENYADPNDRATQEEEFSLELRTRDRERKLLKKIEDAIQRIREDDFGYCEACGVEIGLPRLEVRPTATLCIDCKTVEEIREKQITL